jgi:hypothetical protein
MMTRDETSTQRGSSLFPYLQKPKLRTSLVEFFLSFFLRTLVEFACYYCAEVQLSLRASPTVSPSHSSSQNLATLNDRLQQPLHLTLQAIRMAKLFPSFAKLYQPILLAICGSHHLLFTFPSFGSNVAKGESWWPSAKAPGWRDLWRPDKGVVPDPLGVVSRQ